MEDRPTPRPIIRFCTLEYSENDVRSPASDDAKIIALVIWSGQDEIAIRVHPEWKKIVNPRNRAYLESLYSDFKKRTRSDAEGLFRELSALAVGPLITRDLGPNLYERPEYVNLMAVFKAL